MCELVAKKTTANQITGGKYTYNAGQTVELTTGGCLLLRLEVVRIDELYLNNDLIISVINEDRSSFLK